MAGIRQKENSTYKVYDVAGVVPDRLVIEVNDGTTGIACVANPTAANQECVGVNKETKSNGEYTAVNCNQNDVVWVEGDGTVAAGDQVTNDADGKVTPIAATGTPTYYFMFGKCTEENHAGVGDGVSQLCKIRIEKKEIYI